MNQNIFTIRIPEEDEVFSFKVASAEISASIKDGSLEFGINVFAEEKEFEEGNFAEPFASLGSVILPFNNIEEMFTKGIDIANGYDEESPYSPHDMYLTDLYFLEHLVLNNNIIEFSNFTGETVEVRWTGTASEHPGSDDNLIIELIAKAKISFDEEFIRPY